MSTVSLGEAVDQIAERVGASADLAPFRGWEVNLLAPGEAFETEFEPDGIATFVSCKKMDGAYFDFVVYNNTDVANDRTKTAVPGLNHSGDVGSLLHFVRASRALLEDSPFVLGVVGYNVRMLRLFSNQLPAVCIPDPGTRTIRIVGRRRPACSRALVSICHHDACRVHLNIGPRRHLRGPRRRHDAGACHPDPSILELLEIEKKMSPTHVQEVRSMLECSGVCGSKDHQDGMCDRIVLCQLSHWKDTASAETQVISEAFEETPV